MNEFLMKFKQLDSKTRTIGLGVLLLLVFILDFMFLIRPQFSQFVKIGKNQRELRNNIDSTAQNIERARFLRSEVDHTKKMIVALQDRLVAKDAMTSVLERIAITASHNGVDIIRIIPDGREPKVLLEKNSKKYLALSVVLEVEAGYHDFGRFISVLENDAFFIRMEKFSIIGSDNGPHKITLTLNAVMFDGQKIILDQTVNNIDNGVPASGGSGPVFQEQFPGVPTDAAGNTKILDQKS